MGSAEPHSRLELAPNYDPDSFAERGVAVCFTTPMLAGTRARRTAAGVVELIVPNPSRGRGMYVLSWPGVQELCRPTLHDHRLHGAIAALDAISPAKMRDVARAIAAEGFAGRAAQLAARDATEAIGRYRLLTNFGLLIALVRAVEPPGRFVPPEQETPAALKARARAAVARIAPGMGHSAEMIATMLEQIADLLAASGLDVPDAPEPEPARIAHLIEALDRLQHDVRACGAGDPDSLALAEAVAGAVGLSAAWAGEAARAARAALADPVALLRRWGSGAAAVEDLVTRPDWLLDGYDQACAVWAEAARPARPRLAAIAVLMPPVPRQAADWLGHAARSDATRAHTISPAPWAAEAAIDAIARNEAALAELIRRAAHAGG